MNRLNSISRLFQIVLILLFLMFTGIGVLIWLAPVPEDQLTQTHTNLINIADGMVKIALGAILGVIGGSRVVAANGRT